MLAQLRTFSLLGIEALPVDVEVGRFAGGAAENRAGRVAGSGRRRVYASG